MPIRGLGQAEALDVCPWLCGGPDYPSTPFIGPVYWVADSLRVLIAIGAVVLLIMAIRSIARATTKGQKCRFLYVVGTALVMTGTEIQHLGDQPNWRFLVSLVSVALGAYGVYQHLFRELPARDRPPRNDRSP